MGSRRRSFSRYPRRKKKKELSDRSSRWLHTRLCKVRTAIQNLPASIEAWRTEYQSLLKEYEEYAEKWNSFRREYEHSAKHLCCELRDTLIKPVNWSESLIGVGASVKIEPTNACRALALAWNWPTPKHHLDTLSGRSPTNELRSRIAETDYQIKALIARGTELVVQIQTRLAWLDWTGWFPTDIDVQSLFFLCSSKKISHEDFDRAVALAKQREYISFLEKQKRQSQNIDSCRDWSVHDLPQLREWKVQDGFVISEAGLERARNEEQSLVAAIAIAESREQRQRKRYGADENTIAAAKAHFGETRLQAEQIKPRLRAQLLECPVCPYCAGPIGEDPRADHIYPVSKGGLSTAANMVYICLGCNTTKSDLTLREFIVLCGFNRVEVELRLEKLNKSF